MHEQYIQLIKNAGYRVFINKEKPTYCYFTDGVRIGYAQWDRFTQRVSSVHKPNKYSGTGFRGADEITPQTLKGALDCLAPHWVTHRQKANTVKWASWDAFHSSNSFNQAHKEV